MPSSEKNRNKISFNKTYHFNIAAVVVVISSINLFAQYFLIENEVALVVAGLEPMTFFHILF